MFGKLFSSLFILTLLGTSSALKIKRDNLHVSFSDESPLQIKLNNPENDNVWSLDLKEIRECNENGVDVYDKSFVFDHTLIKQEIVETPENTAFITEFEDANHHIIIENNIVKYLSFFDYGNSTSILTPDMVKLSITIPRWTFSRYGEYLKLIFEVRGNSWKETNDESCEVSYDDSEQEIKYINQCNTFKTKIVYGDKNKAVFLTPNTAISDGNQENVMIDSNNNKIMIILPRFNRYIYYDPLTFIDYDNDYYQDNYSENYEDVVSSSDGNKNETFLKKLIKFIKIFVE